MEQMLMIRLPTQGEIGERESPAQQHGSVPFYRQCTSVAWIYNLFQDMSRKPGTSTYYQILWPDLWSWIGLEDAVKGFQMMKMVTKWLDNWSGK